MPSTVLRAAQIPYGCGPYGPRDAALFPFRTSRCSYRHAADLEFGALLSFIGGAFATGSGERQDQNPLLFSRRPDDDDDVGGTSGRQASERSRQTERGDSVSQ